MEAPQISIIVPVFNVEDYLRQCLDSIIAQTYTNWECILVDDGSKDKSGSSKLIRELETYGDSVVVENQPVDIEITVDRQIKHIRLG